MREARLNFSIVFQEGALFDSLTVRENVAFCLREHSDLPEGEIIARVRAILRRLEIEDAIDLMPEELSGGMQRRVAIARSLAECEPKMIFYDEPTTGLDPITADHTCSLIRDLAAGPPPERRGFILVTHKVTDAAKVAERFLYLKDKRIVFDGNVDALKNTADPDLRLFINEILWLGSPP
jgi:phospholipid/cholesterol/gamma-HCH transport system ATP-binding protein